MSMSALAVLDYTNVQGRILTRAVAHLRSHRAPRKAKNLGLRGYAVSKTDQPTWCTALVRADEKLMCALDHHLPAPREVEPSLKRKGANRPIWGF